MSRGEYVWDLIIGHHPNPKLVKNDLLSLQIVNSVYIMYRFEVVCKKKSCFGRQIVNKIRLILCAELIETRNQ